MSALNTRRAEPSDLEALVLLLTACGLPADDCAAQIKQLLVIERDGAIVAVGGLELCHGRSGTERALGLVRSFAVRPGFRGEGLAQALYQQVELRARQRGLSALYLLTESASAFFARYGFIELPRSRAPEALRLTRQFSALCPDTATVMVRYLQ